MSHATTRLPQALYRAEQVRRLDALAIDGHGIPGLTLMERAGAAAFLTLASRWPEAREILVCCGGGNNGGDGYVVAALARERGLAPTVLALGDPENLEGDAAAAFARARDSGVPVVSYEGRLPAAEVAVDALFGTGLDRSVAGPYEQVIRELNQAPMPVLAVDIPSGLHADTGRVLGTAVKADVTVSFIGLKRGLFTGDGPELAGRVAYHDLGVPPAIFTEVEAGARRLDGRDARRLLPGRHRNAHKGNFGHVLVVGGDQGMTGAPIMTGQAALRAGAGLVSLAVAPASEGGAGAHPELMVHRVAVPRDLDGLLERASVVAVGPGLDNSDWSRQMVRACLDADRPLVADAGALNLLAFEGGRRDDWILTPHPGEASRLLGTTTATVQTDRFAAAAELWDRYGGTVVLKGAGTLVAAADRPLAVCGAGNPGMSTGGMGDVLTGVISGLLAQGLAPFDAACTGVWVHGAAGDRAARRGERGMRATDLLDAIRIEVNPHVP